MLILKRINLGVIICNHFKTHYDERDPKKKIIKSEILMTYVVPAALLCLASFFFDIKDKFFEILLQLFAIVGGFLINSVVMIAEKKSSIDPNTATNRQITLIKETYDNVSFGVVVCILSSVLCAMYFVTGGIIQNIITCLVMVGIWVFMITIMIVLKRLSKVFS